MHLGLYWVSADLQCPVGSNKKLIQLYPVRLISEDQLEHDEVYFLPNFSALIARVSHIRNHINVLFTALFLSKSAFMVSNIPKNISQGRPHRLMVRKSEYVIPTVTIRPTQVFLQRHHFLSQQLCLLSHHIILKPRGSNGQWFPRYLIMSKNWNYSLSLHFLQGKPFSGPSSLWGVPPCGGEQLNMAILSFPRR